MDAGVILLLSQRQYHLTSYKHKHYHFTMEREEWEGRVNYKSAIQANHYHSLTDWSISCVFWTHAM